VKHTIWVVINKEGRFWKKNIGRAYRRRIDKDGIYDPKTSTYEWVYPDKFTDVLGRAKIFESEKMAGSYCDGKHGIGGVKPLKLVCEEIENV
jgi:hypothetical protein